MKSANCTSTTGRRPINAIPVAAPMKPSSVMGMFRTRPAPKLFGEPLRDLEGSSELAADVLADHEDIRVAAHLVSERL